MIMCDYIIDNMHEDVTLKVIEVNSESADCMMKSVGGECGPRPTSLSFDYMDC